MKRSSKIIWTTILFLCLFIGSPLLFWGVLQGSEVRAQPAAEEPAPTESAGDDPAAEEEAPTEAPTEEDIDVLLAGEETSGLGFELAVRALRHGLPIAREAWESGYLTLTGEEGAVVLVTEDGEIPWTAGQDDLLAEDWFLTTKEVPHA